jgi:hypothetical protein
MISQPSMSILLLSVGLFTACQRPAPTSDSTVEISPTLRAALTQQPDATPGTQPLAITRLTPAEGAVIPWTFEEGEVSWRDRFAANIFRLRVLTPEVDEPLIERFTLSRRVSFPAQTWRRVREAAGEGGALHIELIAANVAPDGSLNRGPVTRTSVVRFSAAGEHPQGRILFASRRRPPGTTPGPIPVDMRSATPMMLDMSGRAEVMIQRMPRLMSSASPPGDEPEGSHEDKPGQGHRAPPEGEEPVAPRRGGASRHEHREHDKDRSNAHGPASRDEHHARGEDRPDERGREDPDHGGPTPAGRHAPSSKEWEHLLPRYRSTDYAVHQEPSKDMTPVPRTNERPAWMQLASSFVTPEGDCMGCHTTSSDGRYLALITQNTGAMPEEWSSALTIAAVLRADDHEVVRTYLGGITVSFHPSEPDLLLYSRFGYQRGTLGRTSSMRGDIYVSDLKAGREWALPGASELDRCEAFPSWTPDGQDILFTRAPPGRPCSGHFGVYEIAQVPWNQGEGGKAETLLGASSDMGANVQPRVSPDGRWVVFFRSREGFHQRADADLWVLPTQGGDARRLSVSTDALESWPVFSPDGRWLAFRSNRDRIDRARGYVARFFEDGHTAPAIPLPVAGGPDGHICTLDWTP